MDIQSKPFAAFAVVLLPDGEIVATTRTDGSLGLPGGKVEADETPLEACIRECEEEGVKVSGLEGEIHRAIVEGKPVIWYKFNTGIFLDDFKEKYRGIKPVAIKRSAITSSFGNEFIGYLA